MSIDKAIISKLESLAQLKLDAIESNQIHHDLNSILKMIESMNELDTSSVEPLIYLHDNVNNLRKDIISDQSERYNALKNSASHTNDFFKVPKIINKEN